MPTITDEEYAWLRVIAKESEAVLAVIMTGDKWKGRPAYDQQLLASLNRRLLKYMKKYAL